MQFSLILNATHHAEPRAAYAAAAAAVPSDGAMRQMMLVCSPTVELDALGQRTSQHGLRVWMGLRCDAATGGAREGSVEG